MDTGRKVGSHLTQRKVGRADTGQISAAPGSAKWGYKGGLPKCLTHLLLGHPALIPVDVPPAVPGCPEGVGGDGISQIVLTNLKVSGDK